VLVLIYTTQNQNINQITAIPLSTSTGYLCFIECWNYRKQRIEVQFNATPFKTTDFRWDLNLNWTQNKSLVVELLNGIENLQLASLQGGISINATPGQPYGTIRGSDYIYADNGNLLLTKQDLHLELEHTKEQVLVTT
jgi:hypothetical protein